MTSRHTLRFEAASDSLVGKWDALRLERVITNLVDNAVKYSPRGGEVDLAVSRESGLYGDVATLVVRDHGIGIPAQDVRRVFERFERGSNVRPFDIGGTGIGLAYVLEVIDAHGGWVIVESEEGVGSTFTVTLPLSPAGGESETRPYFDLDSQH